MVRTRTQSEPGPEKIQQQYITRFGLKNIEVLFMDTITIGTLLPEINKDENDNVIYNII